MFLFSIFPFVLFRICTDKQLITDIFRDISRPKRDPHLATLTWRGLVVSKSVAFKVVQAIQPAGRSCVWMYSLLQKKHFFFVFGILPSLKLTFFPEI